MRYRMIANPAAGRGRGAHARTIVEHFVPEDSREVLGVTYVREMIREQQDAVHDGGDRHLQDQNAGGPEMNRRQFLGYGVATGMSFSALAAFLAAPHDKIRGNSVLGTATVGYRYQRADGGFIFRAGFTPFFGIFSGEKEFVPYVPTQYEDNFSFVPWAGFSLGYGF